MYALLGPDGRDLSEEEENDLYARHQRDLATPGFVGATEFERASVRYLGEPGDPGYEAALETAVARRVATGVAQARWEGQHMRRREREAKAIARARELSDERARTRQEARVELEMRLRDASVRTRYEARLALWRGDLERPRSFWRVRHAGWWWLHNLVAHPLLGLFPVAAMVRLHDWSSGHLSRTATPTSRAPVIPSRWRWFVHNVAVHLAIGLLPCATTFRWHDASAARLRVPGWV